MKVGIEVQRLFRKKKFGIETSALQLIKKLQDLNPRAQFIVYATDDRDSACLNATANLQIKKLNGKLFFDFEHLLLPLASKHDQLDVLHCTGNTRPYFSSVPIVQTLHDVIFMDPISSRDSLYQQFGNYYRRLMVPLTTRKSQAVITVSNYEKERILEKIKIDEKKIRVIYNGIDESRFNAQQDPSYNASARLKYSLPEKFILFLGNTSARKNALRVIEAYALYASTDHQALPIVTPGLSETFIKDHLKKIGHPEKAKLFLTPGYIDDTDLPAIYHSSSLFLFPSVSEGFGMPLIEAMACGTPVVTSGISCLPEIAGDAAILVDPLKTDDIAQAIGKMLSNEEFKIEKIASGIRNARRFSWTKTAEQVMEVYEEVCFNPNVIRQPANKVSYELR